MAMMNIVSRLFARPTPVLSEAGPRDAHALAALHAACFHHGWTEEDFERLLLAPAVTAQRASVGDELVGFILSRRVADEAEILSVGVAAAWRGRGLAGQLLDLHLRRLAALGIRALFLEVDEHNRPACRLYRRAGFREVGRREGYYRGGGGNGSAALVLRRDLT
jgi:ribosomal-protein-alanine N-acetyltransferase